jgi:hypothetical protein
MRTDLKYLYKCFGVGLVVLLISPGCKKQPIETPTFDVSVEKTDYAVSEPVVFTFSGTADVVTFYSGVKSPINAEYKNKDRVSVVGKPQLQFTSLRTGASTQANTLSVLMSKDFANAFNADDIQKATWVDLTSKATLSTGTDTQSGVIDLSDQYTPGASVFLAFKYSAKKDAAVAQPTWTIKSLALDNVAADGTVTSVATTASTWGTYSILNSANNWSFNATALTFTGGAINADDNEDWIISQPIQLDRAQRAFGVSVKISATTKLTTYKFAGYAAPGTYTVSFEAINANKWDTKKIVKELTINVK